MGLEKRRGGSARAKGREEENEMGRGGIPESPKAVSGERIGGGGEGEESLDCIDLCGRGLSLQGQPGYGGRIMEKPQGSFQMKTRLAG